jgi:hypothetical protein
MSLIQEALKRQQEEARKAALQAEPPSIQQEPSDSEPSPVRPQGHVPSIMSPQPPPVAAEAPVEAPPSEEETPSVSRFGDKRTITILVGVVAMALILAGAGIWILKSMRASSAKPRDAATQAAATSASSHPPTAANPSQDQNTTNAVESQAPPIESQEITPASSAQVGTEKQTEDILQGSAADESSVPWPALTVTGVIGRGVKGSAIINGKIVDVGQRIDDVRVVRIGMQTVELEYRGQKRTVRTSNARQ